MGRARPIQRPSLCRRTDDGIAEGQGGLLLQIVQCERPVARQRSAVGESDGRPRLECEYEIDRDSMLSLRLQTVL